MMTDDMDKTAAHNRSYTNLQVIEMLAQHADFVEDVKADMLYLHDSLIKLRKMHTAITVVAFAAGYIAGRWMGLNG
jgi:hypothetical protein